MRFVTSVVLVVLAPLSAAAQMLDAENLGEAIGMLYVESQAIEGTRRFCGTQLPSDKRTFDYHALIWKDKNESELEGLESYISAKEDRQAFFAAVNPAVEATLVLIENIAAEKGEKAFCLQFAADLQSRERDVAKRTPRVSEFVLGYLKAHPLSAIEQQRRNTTDGCIKQSFNKEVNVDDAMQFCECMTDTIFSQLSEAELDEWDRTARARGNVAALPSMQRIQPHLAKCAL